MRRDFARRSGQRSLNGHAHLSSSFVLRPSAFVLAVGPLPWPALFVGHSRGALRAAWDGQRSVSARSNPSAPFVLHPSSIVLAFGPLPWPSQSVPSMAPRGVMRGAVHGAALVLVLPPSNGTHAGAPLPAPSPPTHTANRFRRDRQPGWYPMRIVAAGSYAAKTPAHTITSSLRQVARPRADTASRFRGRPSREQRLRRSARG